MKGTARDFERWRSRGDVAALARVFDAQAPALLRFGIHLIGDASAAEDLVQETVLTALKRAEQYDAARPLERWLAGILVRHAQEMRRESRRFSSRGLAEIVDPESPFEAAARKELSGELACAVDALEEPYRAVILLHLRHGLAAADIAHVLDRSPGAVRVQLHRAREMLRKSLPAGIAGAVVLLAESARGLDSVQAVVMSRAIELSPALVVGAGFVGGGLAVKKLVAAVVILLAGIAAFVVLRSEPRAPHTPLVVASAPVDLAEPPHDAPIAIADVATADERRADVAAAQPPAATEEREKLRGLVLDADTDKPVAGARIALYAPTKMRFSELRKVWWDRIDASDWHVRPADPWPSFESKLTSAMRVDLEEIPVRAAPENGVPPIATAVSDAEGRFELLAESTDGFLTCDAVGYAQRSLATRERGYQVDPKSDRTIYVSKERRMRGAIVDESGAPIREAVALSFYAHSPKNLRTPNSPPRDEQDRRVTIRTDSEGRFDIATDAQIGFVSSLDARWYVVKSLRPETPSARSFWVDLLEAKGDVHVVLAPQLSLLVRDAATHAPIEDAFVTVRLTAKLNTAKTGWFHLEKGRLQLTPQIVRQPGDMDISVYASEAVCSVWKPGYKLGSATIPNLLVPGIVEIDLVRSAAPPITGRVRRGPVGAAGTRVMAIGASEGRIDRGDDSTPHGGAIADADGQFELALPDGQFVLVVEHERSRVRRALDVPVSGPIDVDLDASATLLVQVADASGKPASSRDVRLRDALGIVTRGTTDGRGVARFEGLAAGGHEVTICYAPSGSGFSKDDSKTVELASGATTHVDFTTPGSAPKHARLVVEDGTVAGWTARRNAWSAGGGGEVAPDGRIPVDFSEDRTFVLAAPNGLQHWITMPKHALDGAEVRLRAGGIGYRGEVSEEGTGKPLANIVLLFRTKKDGVPGLIVPVDAEGRFEVRGLADVGWDIYATGRNGTSLELPGDVTWEPTSPPTDPPAHLVLSRPRFVAGAFEGRESVMLEGRFDKEAVAAVGGLAYLSVKTEGVGCTTWMSHEARVGPDGRFRVRIPASGERTLGLYDIETFAKLARDTWQPTGTDPEVRELVLKP